MIVSNFKEEEFEDILIQNLQALGIKSAGKMLYVCPLEGNRLTFDDEMNPIFINQYPCCVIGITGIPIAEAEDNLSKSYNMQFELVCWVAVYESKRSVGQNSDVRELRRAIRQELYRRNPYRVGNMHVILTLESDQQIVVMENVVIYEQRYTGKYFETID